MTVQITPKSIQHTGMATSTEGSVAALGKRFRRLARAGKHRNHRGHRPDPYAPLLPAVIMRGPRSRSLSPTSRPPLAGSGQNHRHGCLWLVDASTAYPRSWTSAFQGCQAGASIANPVFHAPFARISLAWRVFSADTVEASLACFMWCSL